jgi:hypothetical protein
MVGCPGELPENVYDFVFLNLFEHSQWSCCLRNCINLGSYIDLNAPGTDFSFLSSKHPLVLGGNFDL